MGRIPDNSIIESKKKNIVLEQKITDVKCMELPHTQCCSEEQQPITTQLNAGSNNKLSLLDQLHIPKTLQNMRVEIMNGHSVKVLWDPPIKTPLTAEKYRVFWRMVDSGNKTSWKNDTSELFVRIGLLKDGATYECVVKAGNHRGTSTLTEPVRFTVGDKFITSAASQDEDSSHAGVAVAIVLALVVVAAFIVGAVWFIRTRKMLGVKNQGGVAFENPSYLREVNMDHIQVSLQLRTTPA